MRVGHAHGYRMVEFDVKLAADNVSFLLHDATLERTTSGRGRADALLWRELSRLDAGGWHSAKYAGEPLPTLASIARWARAHGVHCNVEIKPTPGRERETGAAVALDAATLWRDADTPPLLSSFSEDVARRGARRRAGAAARAVAGRGSGRLEGAASGVSNASPRWCITRRSPPTSSGSCAPQATGCSASRRTTRRESTSSPAGTSTRSSPTPSITSPPIRFRRHRRFSSAATRRAISRAMPSLAFTKRQRCAGVPMT